MTFRIKSLSPNRPRAHCSNRWCDCACRTNKFGYLSTTPPFPPRPPVCYLLLSGLPLITRSFPLLLCLRRPLTSRDAFRRRSSLPAPSFAAPAQASGSTLRSSTSCRNKGGLQPNYIIASELAIERASVCGFSVCALHLVSRWRRQLHEGRRQWRVFATYYYYYSSNICYTLH